MKLSAWHKKQSDEVDFNFHLGKHDKIYASCIFTWNRNLCYSIPNAIHGGVGIDFRKTLPPEIDRIKPDYYGLYRCDYSLGYTYRACPRRCPFCVVPKMPQDKTHHSIYEFWEHAHRKIRLLNNNTFADPFWRETFEELIRENLILLEEGFDIRLLDDERAYYLTKIKFEKQIHFAFDNMTDERDIKRGIKVLNRAGIKSRRLMFYVLCGFNTTPEEDMHRVLLLKGLGVDPFVMIYRNGNKPTQQLKDFARWVNHKAIFKSVDFKDYKKRISGTQLPLVRE